MSKKQILFIILSSLILGGIGGWVFSRYIIPKINTIPFLTKYNLAPTAGPVVINTREEVRVNEGTDSIAAIQHASSWVAGLLNNSSAIGTLALRGSGIILTTDGIIVTTAEAVSAQGAGIHIGQEVKAVLPDNFVATATVVAVDPSTGLVFIKAPASGLPTAQFGSAKNLQLGQRIITLSADLNENQVVDVVSYLSAGTNPDFAKTDSSEKINETFSVADLGSVPEGSAIISLDGNIEGIYDRARIITVDVIKDALNNYFTNHAIVRPAFGFYYQQLSKTEANQLGTQPGLLLRRPDSSRAAVIAGSPAQQAGLREGDLITAINGININDQTGFEDIASSIKPRDSVKIDLLRNKSQVQIQLTAGKQ